MNKKKTSHLLKELQRYGKRLLKTWIIGNHWQNVSSQDMVRLAITLAIIILSHLSMTHWFQLKYSFFEGVTKKLNEFFTLFQTDQSRAPFLTGTLDSLTRFFMDKFILKSVMDKAHSSNLSQKMISLMSLTRSFQKCVLTWLKKSIIVLFCQMSQIPITNIHCTVCAVNIGDRNLRHLAK